MKAYVFFILAAAGIGWLFYFYGSFWPLSAVDGENQKQKLFGVWCVSVAEEEECYWFDEEGGVLSSAPKPEGSLLLAVSEFGGGEPPVKIGGSVLPEQNWFNFKKIINSWMVKDLPSGKIIVDRGKQEATITLASGLKIFTSLRFDPQNNIRALEKLKSSGELDMNRAGYIDLRGENKIYYK